MLLVRYAALTALVIWLGGLVTLYVLTTPSREVLRTFDLVALVCGAVIVLGLLVIKFVGPPPAAFFPRIGIALMMLVIALYQGYMATTSPVFPLVDGALGFLLLGWYARE